jgi:hypothetical protein
MDDFDAFRLEHGKKVIFFYCHRTFLPMSHEFRGEKWSILKGKTIRKWSPKRKVRAYIVEMLDDLKESENGRFKGYGEKHNWTHKSYLWKLFYANVLILPHNIDLMHQERNVTKSIISICFDVTGFSKDNMNAMKELAALCNRTLLEAKTNTKGNLTRPRAPYYLNPTERKEKLKWLKKIKFPDCYALQSMSAPTNSMS